MATISRRSLFSLTLRPLGLAPLSNTVNCVPSMLDLAQHKAQHHVMSDTTTYSTAPRYDSQTHSNTQHSNTYMSQLRHAPLTGWNDPWQNMVNVTSLSFNVGSLSTDISRSSSTLYPDPTLWCRNCLPVAITLLKVFNKKASIRWQDNAPPISGGS